MNNAKYEVAKVSVIMYVAGCQQMAEVVNSRYFDGCADIYWIGDRYDLCDFSGEWWLTPDEMRQMLESDLSQKDFFEWWDYNLFHAYTHLGSWIMGLRPNTRINNIKL